MPRFSAPTIQLLSAVVLSCLMACSSGGCAPAAKPAARPAAQTEGDDHDHGHDHGHDHDDHAHPQTLAAGIAELQATAQDIGIKLAEGSQEAADDALHAAGHLVEDLQGLLAKEKDLTAEAKEAGKKALDELFECFDKLDTAMHAGADEAKETVADVHASVKERIEAAMTSLKDTFSKEAN